MSHSEAQKRYLQKPGVREARNELNRKWIAANRERYNEAKSEYRFKLKMAAIEYYSQGSMSCAICGYDADIDALCLDHIEHDGAAHRKSLGIAGRATGAGTTMYERLKALGWQAGLQVLCANCNTVKEIQRKRGRNSDQMRIATAGKTQWRKPISPAAAR